MYLSCPSTGLSHSSREKWLYFFFFFFNLAMSLCMQDPSSPTRDRTSAPCSGSTESKPLDCRRSPEKWHLFLENGVRDQDLRASGLIALGCRGFLAFSAAAFRSKASPVFQPTRPCTVGPAHLVALLPSGPPQHSAATRIFCLFCKHLSLFPPQGLCTPMCSAWSASPWGLFHSWAFLVIEMSRPTLRHFSAPRF